MNLKLLPENGREGLHKRAGAPLLPEGAERLGNRRAPAQQGYAPDGGIVFAAGTAADHKAVFADDEQPRLLQVFREQEIALKADDVAAVIPLRLLLRRRADQYARRVFQFLQRCRRQRRQGAARRDFNKAVARVQNAVDVFVGKRPALVAEREVHSPGAQALKQFFVVALFNFEGNARMFGGEQIQGRRNSRPP